MKKNIVEVYFEKEFNENSIVVFHNKKWMAIDKSVFLNNVYKSLSTLDSNLNEYKEENNKNVSELAEKCMLVLKHLLGYTELSDEQLDEILGENNHEEE